MWERIKKENELEEKFGMWFTENGALTYNSSLSSVLDLFFKIPGMRAANVNLLWGMFAKAWRENPELTIRVMLWTRDIRGGAGERRVFREFLKWMNLNGHYEYLKRITYKVPDLGRWDDLFVLPVDEWISLVKGHLYRDALLAKWLPREKSRKWKGLAKVIAKKLGMSMREYRKTIAELSKTVEQQMSKNRWNEVEYSKVPSIASMRYSKAFMRHDEYRYREFIENVKKGKEKINVSILFPHDIVKNFRGWNVDNIEQFIVMWDNLPNYLENVDGFVLPVVDFSGSMQSTISMNTEAYDVAIGLGLYFADKQPKPWNNIVIPFSRTARFVVLPEGNIYQKYKVLDKEHEAANTNLQAVFNLILQYAREHGLSQNEMPKYLLIISDMEFDRATSIGYNWYGGRSSWDTTNYQAMKEKFYRAGYELPTIVFWNVMFRHSGNIPVRATENGVVLIGGYSPQIMKTVLQLNENNINPINMMLNTIMVERYNF